MEFFFDHLFVNEEIMIMLIGGDIKNGWVKILKGWSSDPLVFNTHCCPFSPLSGGFQKPTAKIGNIEIDQLPNWFPAFAGGSAVSHFRLKICITP